MTASRSSFIDRLLRSAGVPAEVRQVATKSRPGDAEKVDDSSSSSCSRRDYMKPIATITMSADEYERRRDVAQQRQICTSSMSPEEVRSLHDADPFMYYSIPGVHRAALILDDDLHDSYADLLVDFPRNGRCHDYSAPPERKRPRRTVSRRTQISFEAHPNLIMEDLLDELSASCSSLEISD